jgi:hypothetical protein
MPSTPPEVVSAAVVPIPIPTLLVAVPPGVIKDCTVSRKAFPTLFKAPLFNWQAYSTCGLVVFAPTMTPNWLMLEHIVFTVPALELAEP